jgi:putative oxygen-independent coproporphyrinogen III oxidase
MFNFATFPPLSLYIHIPWCVRKCPYCDFNSHQIRADISESHYIKALLTDLEQNLVRVSERKIHSIFFGGGTPSILSPDAIDNLLSAVRQRIPIMAEAEITLEANPSTVDNERFQGFYQAGINRLSIGIQSFNDDSLKKIGRIHGSLEARKAIESAKTAGFNNINIDLMFGLPAQTEKMALADLEIAASFQPAHISWYQLTIEPNTLFYHQTPTNIGDEDLLWQMQIAGQEYLAAQNYKQYEISAYARTHKCKHNLNYWKFGDYLGIGAGAHSKITNLDTIIRLSKQRHPQTYLESTDKIVTLNQLTIEDVKLEFMMNALRLVEGFTKQEFERNTGLKLAAVATPIQEALNNNWLQHQNGRFYATSLGMRFLNDLLALFM